ncbi:MAG TPA: fatty acid desaturase [Planctomycetaceae bacterium]|nr:fatty acid desaturase [Planctomycetaceae bacterium]
MTQDAAVCADARASRISELKPLINKYQIPSNAKAIRQVANSLGPYLLLWFLMYLALQVSWWLVVPIAVLTGAFLVRIFIIFHDCGHGSYFSSSRANRIVGFFCAMLVFTPYEQWRREHAAHHASAGNLDRRGLGDIWTMTVKEYQQASTGKRILYRVVRNPFFLFVIAPAYMFIISQRIPLRSMKRRERLSVWQMNLAVLAMVSTMMFIFGVVPYLVIQLIVITVGGSAGFWLFYIQHQFEGVYWERDQNWDFIDAALQGSSFYKLPKVLQWFSGNIGFHHIHHLGPRIPNYNLERCHDSHPMFKDVHAVTLLSSFSAMSHHLWDESSHRLVAFREVSKIA